MHGLLVVGTTFYEIQKLCGTGDLLIKSHSKANEYDQEIPQSHIADQPTAQ